MSTGDLAARTCASLAELGRLVDRDAPAKDVLALLNEANEASDQARDEDPRWVQLASAVDVLDEAIRADRAEGLTLALQLIDQQCAPASPTPQP